MMFSLKGLVRLGACAGGLLLCGCQSSAFQGVNAAHNGALEGCAPGAVTASQIVGGVAGTVTPVDEVDAFLASRMNGANVPGLSVAVINQAEVVYARTLGFADVSRQAPVTGCTIFEGASITKPLFGYLVMTFVEDGSLDLDRPLLQYLPNGDLAADDRYLAMTARMVLSHQTGLPNWWSDEPERVRSLNFAPGAGFGYSGEGYQYLARVLQEIAGVDGPGLEALFQDRVARPLGMTRTRIIPSPELLARKAAPHLSDGTLAAPWVYDAEFGAAYGVNSEAVDFSRWLIALMKRDGLSGNAFDAYFEPQDVEIPYDPAPDALSLGRPRIALGLFVYDVPGLGRFYSHDGNNLGFSSLMIVHPESGWGLVAFANGDRSTSMMLELAMFLNAPPG